MTRGSRLAAELFIDTSAWYPLAHAGHADHARLAAALEERLVTGQRIVTTNLVMAETHALLLRRGGRAAALGFVREVVREPILVERSTEERERRAVEEWLARYDDQDFSLTDAVSFVVMEERGIETAFALDRHFLAAGFSVVPAR